MGVLSSRSNALHTSNRRSCIYTRNKHAPVLGQRIMGVPSSKSNALHSSTSSMLDAEAMQSAEGQPHTLVLKPQQTIICSTGQRNAGRVYKLCDAPLICITVQS